MDSIKFFNEKKWIESAVLKVQWANGQEQILHEDRGYGYYSNVNGHIYDIILTDIDGDGIIDLYFASSEKGKWVILIQKDNTFIKRQIKKAVSQPVGGC